MVFAVIPWDVKFNNNEIFNTLSSTNKNGLAEPYLEMKKRLNELGHTINTIDLYDDLKKVDYFLFFDWFPEWIHKLSCLGLSERLVYCNAEPPTVRKLNSIEGYRYIKRFFPYIMTWNKELVDNQCFFYRTIPYNFVEHENKIAYAEKKLLTSISANKKSDYKDELYTERERLITFFENEMPDDFDMYGVGWTNSGHKSYKGRPESKFETYAHYKFALALENTSNVKGYITEKIFDCLTGNIVPIYLGADDITDYVPKDCFIDYRDYESPQALKEYLLSIDEEKYNAYLLSAKRIIQSVKLRYAFSGKMYADNILYMVQHMPHNTFRISAYDRCVLFCAYSKLLIKRQLSRLKHRCVAKK